MIAACLVLILLVIVLQVFLVLRVGELQRQVNRLPREFPAPPAPISDKPIRVPFSFVANQPSILELCFQQDGAWRKHSAVRAGSEAAKRANRKGWGLRVPGFEEVNEGTE